ncbi:metallophosphoesterase family protein [Natronomonas marina]|jgi:putative phosphoesterase|uniref:metallophosphoesterase family protein n=1 Tax=Natronomonas marina TaxID=2961939 RepID=UPI0020C98F9F|nr:metallophosphoesterase family protein [Natronomonas marina]
MQVVVLSDTHVKSRAPEISEWVRAAIADADHAIHAGDFDSRPAYETVADLAADLTAVRGNTDGNYGLSEVATADLGGVRFVVTHGTGPDAGYEERVAGIVAENAAADRPTVGVSGHTHRLLDTRVDGYRLLNPGSATGAWPAGETTFLAVDVEAGDLDVEVRRA